MLDKKHGQGIFFWPDKTKYIGQWRNGKQHGKGRMVTKSGEEKEGYWEKGKRVRWVSDEY